MLIVAITSQVHMVNFQYFSSAVSSSSIDGGLPSVGGFPSAGYGKTRVTETKRGNHTNLTFLMKHNNLSPKTHLIVRECSPGVVQVIYLLPPQRRRNGIIMF